MPTIIVQLPSINLILTDSLQFSIGKRNCVVSAKPCSTQLCPVENVIYSKILFYLTASDKRKQNIYIKRLLAYFFALQDKKDRTSVRGRTII